jgi:hypothetical protein
MKAIRALILLKKYKLIHKNYKLKHLKMVRVIFEDKTWEDFIRNILAREYLIGTRDLSKPIYIPEVKMAIGGTLSINVGKLE